VGGARAFECLVIRSSEQKQQAVANVVVSL
jgi:hypothetical protein